MAAFMGRVQGSKGAATRLGSARSGLVTDAKSWDIGVSVQAEMVDGLERFVITARSVPTGELLDIGIVRMVAGEIVFQPAHLEQGTTYDVAELARAD